MGNIFDIDGRATWRTAFSTALLRVYNAPQPIFFKPLNDAGFNPVFVVGCGHSGTSLLATVLGRSSRFFMIGYESGAFFPKRGIWTSKEIVRVWINLARQFGCDGFVEKTPKHIHAIARIRKVVPRAKFVAIVRDGRDVLASFKTRGFEREFAINRWCGDNRKLIAHLDEPDFYLVRFETLVSDPETTIKNLCAGLGVEFEPRMIEGSDSAYQWIDTGNMALRAQQTRGPIRDTRGKWKKNLSQEDLRAFWSRAQPVMQALGYGGEATSAPGGATGNGLPLKRSART